MTFYRSINNNMTPEINEMITTQKALELCRHFGLDYLIDRIESHPEKYKDWKFDGCSGLPDKIMVFFTGCNWKSGEIGGGEIGGHAGNRGT